MMLRGVTYDMDGNPSMGLVAQEVQKIFPELVIKLSNGQLTVAYDNFVGLIIQAIKELKREVDLLKQ